MHFVVEQVLLRAWTRISWLSCLLWPVSLIMRLLVLARRTLYRLHILKSQRVNALVVVVGNVVAGGAGKTPTVIHLVKHLQAGGILCGVVSRGYTGKNQHCQEVLKTSSPFDVGDEPLLVHLRTGVPVFVGKSRVMAAHNLLQHYPQVQVIVCDDGLQHYPLFRDIEICVFDNRGCGNRLLLPAGPLREPWPLSALASAGQNPRRLLVLHTGSQPAFEGYRAQRRLADAAIDSRGQRFPLDQLSKYPPKPLMALAGIAQPEIFFEMLRASGLPLEKTLPLPDHYHFKDIAQRISPHFQIICTEKDAVKLWEFVPDALCVGLEQTPEPDFLTAFDACLEEVGIAPLSSHHGHQTT